MGRTADLLADDLRRIVKNVSQTDAAAFKIHVVGDGPAHIARPQQHRVGKTVHSQDMADFIIELGDHVAIALLAETTEAVEILPDLGSG